MGTRVMDDLRRRQARRRRQAASRAAASPIHGARAPRARQRRRRPRRWAPFFRSGYNMVDAVVISLSVAALAGPSVGSPPAAPAPWRRAHAKGSRPASVRPPPPEDLRHTQSRGSAEMRRGQRHGACVASPRWLLGDTRTREAGRAASHGPSDLDAGPCGRDELLERPVRDRPVRDRPVRDRPVRDRPVRDRPLGPVRDPGERSFRGLPRPALAGGPESGALGPAGLRTVSRRRSWRKVWAGDWANGARSGGRRGGWLLAEARRSLNGRLDAACAL